MKFFKAILEGLTLLGLMAVMVLGCIILAPEEAFPQKLVSVNGTLTQVPEYPLNEVKLYGATAGQLVGVGPSGLLVGLSTISLSSTPNYSITNLPNTFLQNMTLAQLLAYSASPFYRTEAISVGQIITGGADQQVDGLGIYQRTTGAVTGGGGGTVGVYMQNDIAVDNLDVWGADFNLGDGGHAGITEYGIEIDANATVTSTSGAALFFGASMTVQPTNLGAINIPQTLGGGRWSYGFAVADGAVQNGNAIDLGAVNPSASSASQYIQMNWRDGSNVGHQCIIQALSNGVVEIGSLTGGCNGVQSYIGNITTGPGYMGAAGNVGKPPLPTGTYAYFSANDQASNSEFDAFGGNTSSTGSQLAFAAYGAISGSRVFAGGFQNDGTLVSTKAATASTTASNYSVPIFLNGTTYYVRLSSTP